MTDARATFRFRPGLTVAAIIGVAVLVSLGTWQLHRRAWKLDLIAQVEARANAAPIPFDEARDRADAGEDMSYQPVRAVGVFDHGREARVFGSLDGAAGVYVFTPLTREGARALYVNRGFAPQALADPADRAEGQVAGEVVVTGLFRTPSKPGGLARAFQAEDQPEDNLWFARDPVRFAAHAGLDAEASFIDSDGAETSADWPRGGATRLEFSNRHLEYALTWFGLAAALIGVYAARSFAR
ncbi:MAG: SURF1 family protein [Parvularculaceae bacterium]